MIRVVNQSGWSTGKHRHLSSSRTSSRLAKEQKTLNQQDVLEIVRARKQKKESETIHQYILNSIARKEKERAQELKNRDQDHERWLYEKMSVALFIGFLGVIVLCVALFIKANFSTSMPPVHHQEVESTQIKYVPPLSIPNPENSKKPLSFQYRNNPDDEYIQNISGQNIKIVCRVKATGQELWTKVVEPDGKIMGKIDDKCTYRVFLAD